MKISPETLNGVLDAYKDYLARPELIFSVHKRKSFVLHPHILVGILKIQNKPGYTTINYCQMMNCFLNGESGASISILLKVNEH